eukprot:gb/GEZN01001296.1/.p1 GENE.gb/GEZN01001296.1/~~gb/GEZN01001296.1/.p1  ORF type:complete len:878 (+),score=168.53 gb/GEZN01001296.1/:176-2809(+)
MIGFDYVALDEGLTSPVRSILHPVRAAAGALGMALLTLGSYATHKLFSAEGVEGVETGGIPVEERQAGYFLPVEGIESVKLESGPPGPLQLLPWGDPGPAALFWYSHEVPPELEEGATKFVGWVYGAKMAPNGPNFGDIALVTGKDGDVLKGDLLVYKPESFKKIIAYADEFWGYDYKRPTKGQVQRHPAQVVKEDGSTVEAQVYLMPWSTKSIPANKPPAEKVPLAERDFTKLLKKKTFIKVRDEVTKVISWNIAAINNNPFEYWTSHPDPDYNALMRDVQEFMEKPGARDVPISEVFTEMMFWELSAAMGQLGWDGVQDVTLKWMMEISKTNIISGFIQDKSLGEKRLISMPDRLTNSIRTADGIKYRPTIINNYAAELGSTEDWFKQWKAFMFDTELDLVGEDGAVEKKKPVQLLSPISAAKYPALTKDEEEMSLPLQTSYQAIFDATMVHIMNTVAPGKWHPLKVQLIKAQVEGKSARILHILGDTYGQSDVFFLQEVASGFASDVTSSRLNDRFHMVMSEDKDMHRDQNSAILLRKEHFAIDTIKEVTADVLKHFQAATPVEKGDLLVVTVEDSIRNREPWLLASFHGDTQGLATVPVLNALATEAAASYPGHKFVFGLDANTYDVPEPKKKKKSASAGVNQSVWGFADTFTGLGLTSSWGDKPDPTKHTTCNARTFLQPQLNKAVRIEDRFTSPLSDRNPKDFILFRNTTFKYMDSIRDNTGHGKFTEQMMFPTLSFPSDHAIVATKLVRIRPTLVFRLISKEKESESSKIGRLMVSEQDKESGFIHLATKEQVPEIAEKFFKDEEELRLLAIKTAPLGGDLRYEYVAEEKDSFPHYHQMDLMMSLVTAVASVPKNEDGSFNFDPVWIAMQ